MSQKWVTAAFFAEGILLYSLGLGMAKYLGSTILWDRVWIGMIWVVCLQMGGNFLWRHSLTALPEQQSDQRSALAMNLNFLLGLAAFACLASITVLMIANRIYSMELFWVTLAAVLGTLISSRGVRVARLERFREILISFLMAVLIPWFGFLLQAGELHRFLPLITLPILALRMAMILSYQLSTYASDMNTKNPTLMIRVGWQNGMSLHNSLILFAFVLIAFGNAIGVPLSIGLPPMGALTVGLWQIWMMRRIALGVKPNWMGLILGGAALYSLVVYLFSYSFWIR